MNFKSNLAPMAAACAVMLLAGAGRAAADYPNVLRFECDDVVVITRIQTMGSLATVQDNILDRAQFMMRLEIRKIVRGTEKRKTVTAHQFLHQPWRSDREYLAVLTHEGDEYRVREAAVWDRNSTPSLRDMCSK